MPPQRSADWAGNPLARPVAATILGLVITVMASACSVLPWQGGSDEPAGVIGSQALDRPVQETATVGEALFAPQLLETVRFAAGACPFEVPPGLTARCGTVEVPADWGTGEGSIELPVAVLPSSSPNPAPDPVIYLEGGPGSHTLETLIYSADDLIRPVLERGDMIFFDQRGAGLAVPRLFCEENEAVTRLLEDDPSLSSEQAQKRSNDALAACRERLVESGIDLTDYNSINSAHDVEAIRIALGYESWNIYGISYGTKLGLEVLRRHPEAVRTAVLDSVYPPQVNSVRDNPGTFVESYEAVVAACDREPSCAEGGDLADRITAVVAALDEAPIQVEVHDWIANETDEIFVTGSTVVGLVVGALYSPYRFTDIPELITELESGRTDALRRFLDQERSTERFFTDGMFYAIACHEEISFAEESEVVAALPADPFGQTDRFDLASNTGTTAFDTCQAFENGQAPSSSNEPVSSDVPTLLMAGRFDPVTPVAWAEQAAETLENSTLVVAEQQSHGVSPGECGMAIMRQFLDAPGTVLNVDCFADEDLTFVADVDETIDLEAAAFDIELLEVSVETVRPVSWSIGSLNGDQYRQQSFLDPTQFLQLAGDFLAKEALSSALGEEFGFTVGQPQQLGAGTGLAVGSTPVDDLNRTWTRRSGRSESVAIEWFESEIDGIPTVVALVASIEELDGLLDALVVPALQTIEVQPLQG